MQRVNIITLVIGNRGTGKTTYIKGDQKLKVPGIIQAYQQKISEKKILVVDTFDNPVWREYPDIQISDLRKWKSGVRRLWGSDTDVIMHAITHYVYNTVIVFEDSTKFIPSRLPGELRKVVLDSKQKNIDIFFLFHYLMACPNDLVRISDYLVLFKTNEVFLSLLRSKYANPDVEKAFIRVKNNPSKYYNQTIVLSA